MKGPVGPVPPMTSACMGVLPGEGLRSLRRRLREWPDRANCNKKETPDGSLRRGFRFKSLAVTYSCMTKGHTTIGAGRFHFRVRNGIGWFPLAIAARQTGSRTLSRGDEFESGMTQRVAFEAIPADSVQWPMIQADWVLYGQASRAISTG